jgi:hypothetical protein
MVTIKRRVIKEVKQMPFEVGIYEPDKLVVTTFKTLPAALFFELRALDGYHRITGTTESLIDITEANVDWLDQQGFTQEIQDRVIYRYLFVPPKQE